MAWFDPFDWAPPAEHAGEFPYLLWTDAAQLSILWLSNTGAFCRQDYLVDKVGGTVDLVDTRIDETAGLFNQKISKAHISPSGHLMIETEELGAG